MNLKALLRIWLFKLVESIAPKKREQKRDEQMGPLGEFVSQIRDARKSNLYYLSLYASITIPDICASLEYEDNLTNRNRYIQWYQKYVEHQYPVFSASRAYAYRCSLLHQGQSTPSERSVSKLPVGHEYERVLFLEPGVSGMSLNVRDVVANGQHAVIVDINCLVDSIMAGVELFLKKKSDDIIVQANIKSLIRRYPNGLPPFIIGSPVIA